MEFPRREKTIYARKVLEQAIQQVNDIVEVIQESLASLVTLCNFQWAEPLSRFTSQRQLRISPRGVTALQGERT
jgi:hypothetical protein